VANRRKEEPPFDITLPITPMLDMSFQLLSFFIITFKVMPIEGQLSVNLPKLDATNTPPVDTPLPDENKKDEYRITVYSQAGEVSLMTLTMPTEAPKEEIKSFQQLFAELQRIPKPPGRGPEAISITIEAAPDLNYARLIEIMDLCKRAGYESVNLMPLGKGQGG
jgi:biopolymer transport protein ExbD